MTQAQIQTEPKIYTFDEFIELLLGKHNMSSKLPHA